MRYRQANGFTLIEILVVVVILAIVGLIAVPYLGGNDSVKLGSVARIAMSNLYYAQNHAITHQRNVYVTFHCTSDDGNGVRLDVSLAPAPTAVSGCLPGPDNMPMRTLFGSSQSRPLSQTTLKQVTLNGSTSTSTTTMGFDHLGQPLARDASGDYKAMTSAARIRFAVSNNANSTQDLVIQPYTGEITTP